MTWLRLQLHSPGLSVFQPRQPPCLSVPGTTVKILPASSIDQLEHREVLGVEKVRDFSLFWFPRQEPLVVCGARRYSEAPVEEWRRVMKLKFKSRSPDE